jgi:coenzyme PQQ precursor peptide PqqA
LGHEWHASCGSVCGDQFAHLNHPYRRLTMQWTTPSFADLRFGFEITMYIANR